MMRRTIGLAGLLLGCWVLGGCGNGSGGGTGSGGASGEAIGPENAKYKLGFSQCTSTEPWRVLFNQKLWEAARKTPDIRLTTLDANDRTEDQVAQVRAFIRQKVSAILISPKEAAGLTRVVEEASAAGIPVILLDRNVNTDKYASWVGGDNLEIGKAAGKAAVDLLGGPGKAKGVIYEICGGMATAAAQERRDGFHQMVEKEPGVRIIGGLDADWKKDKAQTIMQDALKANPDITMVYAHNDPMAHGAYLAAKAAGKAASMMFIGVDAMPDEGQRWVKTGELTATLLYPTPGERGLEVAMDVLAGKPVERRYVLPTRLFLKNNVDSGGVAVDLGTATSTAPAQ